jgi:GTPase SAR1 family protein
MKVTPCLSVAAIVIVFDLTSLMSLSHCQQWLEEALSANSGSPHIFLVGTKGDLMVWRQI